MINMTNWKEIVSKFERQLDNSDLTTGERDALKHRIKWITMLHREKPSYQPTKATDPVYEALTNPNYRGTPASLLQQ